MHTDGGIPVYRIRYTFHFTSKLFAERNALLVSLSRKGKHNWYAESFAHGIEIHPLQKKHAA